MPRLLSRAAWLAPLAVLAACGEEPARCPGDEAPGTVTEFSVDELDGTEGIAFSPEGRLFVSAGERIVEVKPDGTWREHSRVPRSLGVAWWKDALYVAGAEDGNQTSGACVETRRGGVWRVGLDGKATLFATGVRAPNFLTVTPWGTLLVSDDCHDNRTIHEVDGSGKVTAWSEGVPSPNGMAFVPGKNELFVATTLVDPPPLWRIPFGASNRPASIEVAQKVFEFPRGATPDGLAVDADGNVYTALNYVGELHRTNDAGTEPFANGVQYAASMAFGVGEGWDSCSMYVTSLRFAGTKPDLYRVRVGVPGAALPR